MTAGGTKCRAAQHVQIVMRTGIICSNVQTVSSGLVQNVEIKYGGVCPVDVCRDHIRRILPRGLTTRNGSNNYVAATRSWDEDNLDYD
jgi:hypothetical protein